MNLIELCSNVKKAKYDVARLTESEKNNAIKQVCDSILAGADYILQENAKDIENGEKNGMHVGLLDRLRLTTDRIEGIVEGLRQIISLPDPIGEVMETIQRPNGLFIEKCRVPMGVIGIIYEARPNVTVDAFGLCFKSGNAVILKGGSAAFHSNIAIVDCIKNGLKTCGINENVIGLISDTDRETTQAFMKMNDYVDVLIPRGGAGLIRSVVENSTIPVIETGTGNCHIYVDKDADPDMAVNIIFNAKTQRIGVCNACESLVIHNEIKEQILPKLAASLKEKEVEIRGDKSVCEIIDCKEATETDYATEYLDYIISVKTVSSVNEAIAHINCYNTGHSDAIITNCAETAEKFLNEVDSACVYVNASTRFTDGFEFGFGAEIGISTQMLHARGPMGLKELTSYKFKVRGSGQIRG
ncbi:MAG: glutamate-5-semialdehyde dehydrogenase [Lachnospiraceae bacterium]|nr:glutamate-5-semialdehyde dehydrogenase [Lachnospiraceae bacterium]